MATSLTKNGIESAIVRVRAQPSGRIELRDDKEAGLVFRAGERSSTWSLAVRLQDGQRSRIKLGTWPGMGIAEARAAARVARTQIDQGSNPDERKREIISGRVASPETSGASNWSAITIVAAKPVRPRSGRLGATPCRAGVRRACRRRPPGHSFAARRGRPAACLSPVVPAFVWPRGPRLRAVQARRNPRAAPRSSDRAHRPDRRTGIAVTDIADDTSEGGALAQRALTWIGERRSRPGAGEEARRGDKVQPVHGRGFTGAGCPCCRAG